MIKINLRTIKQATDYLKTIDPDTAITGYCIRQLVKEGKIHCKKSGTKHLIYLDELLNYFALEEKNNDTLN